MKRLLALLLVLAMLSVFSGCQKPEYHLEEIPSTPPTQQTEALTQPVTMPPQTTAAATQPTEAPTEPVILPEPEDEDFVRVLDYIPEACQELGYATENNFTGQPIYEFYEAYLRYGTVKKLMLVSGELAQQGLYIKIWDGFRPVSAQFKLWEVCPDPTYVANPETGYSSHSRGNTIDLTLVDETGQELEMPTGFDDFSPLANRDYSDCPETAAANAKLLQEVMEKYGFTPYFGEWWHFSDTQSYPVEREFQPNAG